MLVFNFLSLYNNPASKPMQKTSTPVTNIMAVLSHGGVCLRFSREVSFISLGT